MDLKLLASVLIAINVVACFVMMLDKRYAIKNKWRLSEDFLLTFALIGGSVGLIIGMVVFRHKLSKLKFRVVVPLGICLYTAVIFYFLWIEKITWL